MQVHSSERPGETLPKAATMISETTEQRITAKIGQLTVLSRLGVKTTLGPVTALLNGLNHPENTFPSIHIGGTSGKGSTSTFLANILYAAGYKTGLFTKPHLQSVRERFVINQAPISPTAILALLERMPSDMEETPTWFELMVALAFQYFADQRVDFGVIEVGLGGTYDATNVIFPQLSILTNVGLDHTDVLGDTIEKIAADKVGIFKPGRPVVSGVSQPSVVEIVEQQCARLGSSLKLLGRDFHISQTILGASGSRFDFEMDGQRVDGLSISMLGEHQVLNASTAVAAALVLRETGCAIPTSAIRAGLAHTRVPGRMEILPGYPNVILDGAHSPPKMEAFCAGLRTLFPNKDRLVGVLSFSLGHDVQDTLLPLAPLLDTAILTGFTAETDYGNKRAQDPQQVAVILSKMNPGIKIIIEPDPINAIQRALHMRQPNDLICVTGSIFLVGQIRQSLSLVDGGIDVSHP
jgi:dihydrofolate synthase / folylpolyglutamate synthase